MSTTNPLIWDHFEYHVASHFLSAIINDDHTGLTATESTQLAGFIADAVKTAHDEGFTPMHWDAGTDYNGEDFRVCDVCNQSACCVQIQLLVTK